MNTPNQGIPIQGLLLLLAGWLGAGEALAHNFTGTLGAAANAQAQYMLTCYPVDGYSTQGVSFSISGLTKSRPYKLKLTVAKGSESADANDPANGDRKPGLPISLAAGEGAYFLTIGKVPAAKGNMVFEVDIHCLSSSGYHTGTTEPVKLTTIASGIAGFSGSLKASPAAQAKYLVACYPEGGRITGRYGFKVSAVTKKRNFGVKLTVKKDNGIEEAVDFTPGDVESSGDWSYLEEGDGAYELTLSKEPGSGTAKGTMVFKVENMCEAEEPPALSGITAAIRQ